MLQSKSELPTVQFCQSVNCNKKETESFCWEQKGERMTEEKIARINQLYHKSKEEGLTAEEKIEQANLRKEYIAAIRADLQSTLNNVSVLNPDGTVTDLKDMKKKKR